MSDASPDPEPTGLPQDLLALLRRPSPCFVSTLAEDGTPHAASVWVDTDGRHILVATRQGEQEARNAARDARIAVAVGDPDDPAHVYRVRGRVRDITTAGAVERRRTLARRYLGRSPEAERADARSDDLVLVIVPHKIALAA
jgi:PPOX class probable F420-dependent enzyme